MNHRRILDSLGLFLDGELEDEARRLVEDHLRTCPECRREFALLRKLEALARSIPPPPREDAYFEEFPSRVRAALERGGG